MIAIEGHADPETVSDVAHVWCRLGAAGRIIKTFKQQQVGDLVMAGTIRRPGWLELRPDWYGLKLLARLRSQGPLGDDGLLTFLGKVLEQEGFQLLGAHQLSAELLAEPGLIGNISPTPIQQLAIEKGCEILQAIGRFDIGQAIVVQNELVLGIEAIEGTDELIRRTAPLARKGSKPLLVKMPKPQQDLRFDLPTIGAQTMREIAAAGFAGIVVQAGRTILLDADELPALANTLGIFLLVLPHG